MKRSTKRLQFVAAMVGAAALAAATPELAQAGAGRARQRPIEDFLSSQGTYCIDDGAGGCLLFVPPDPNFLGWQSDLDFTPIYFAGVDYAGLANAYGVGQEPEITGSVSERPLADGRAEVKVLLHTKNANLWVIDLDLAGDVLWQIAAKPTLFGHRPADVMRGAEPALADSFLHVVFVNSAPGAPLPDLMAILNGGSPAVLKTVSFQATAHGPLTAEFGATEGSPGLCKISQTGLLSTSGQGQGIADAFPAEIILLRPIGN